ncbi:MAG: ABC transporter ATP-binding protein [Planctomycetes bacterium]|nr:ABC transporter ATP-binding protein [Planctomycetota bacterium]
MITVQHLTRRFGPRLAVDDVSFHLERGEVVGFLGPNGAGKTTTMRVLTGFLPPSAGTVEVGGHDVLRDSLAVRERIGYLPESVPLYREHRVQEMLVFQGRLRGLARAEAKRRAGLVLERVGLSERARSLIGRLSKGQRQRVGLAVALLPDPEVLVLDEPTSGLDPLQRIEVRRLIQELARERTVLLSSHILPEIEAVCPRVIILQRGRLAADGTQTELLARLGGGNFVRLELAAGPDGATPDAAALALVRARIAALPDVTSVEARGGEGDFAAFEVRGQGALAEGLGRLAQREGWAVRELSTQRPTLEGLFARIALELEPARPDPAQPEGSLEGAA